MSFDGLKFNVTTLHVNQRDGETVIVGRMKR